jgi:phosphoglycolate phosphatase
VTSTLPTRPEAAPPLRTWSAVLFDLDGTIVDSEAEITRSLAHTFSTMGVPVPDAETLRSYVGPPLLDSLRMTGGFTDADAWEALNVYRDHYDLHLLSSPVFPGVAGVLQRLQAAGMPVALATSKPESMARAVLEHNDLAKYFTVVAGASEDEERSTKADVVREALHRLAAHGVDTADAVMVGDRAYDTHGALANGVPTILVEWGYGSPAEAGDAYAVVHSADQLRSLLLG